MTHNPKVISWTGQAFRAARAAKYFFFFVAALVTMIAPSTIIFGIFSQVPFFIYFWSALFVVGSLCCLYGIVKKKWVGEYVGLPGIITCLTLYAIGCFVDTPALTVQRIFLGFVFLAFTFSSLARRQDVNFQKRVAEHEQRVREGKPGL